MIQKAIQRLEFLLSIIPDHLENIDSTNFSHKPSPENWSKKEILGHLIDSAANNHHRFVRVQAEDSPTIWYDQNKWVQGGHYSEMDKSQLISFWRSYNMHLAVLMKLIPANTLNRTCMMKNGDKVTLEFLMIDYVEHLEHHLMQITDY
jgi:hypothetical protein